MFFKIFPWPRHTHFLLFLCPGAEIWAWLSPVKLLEIYMDQSTYRVVLFPRILEKLSQKVKNMGVVTFLVKIANEIMAIFCGF